jgi:hypothetical protein
MFSDELSHVVERAGSPDVYYQTLRVLTGIGTNPSAVARFTREVRSATTPPGQLADRVDYIAEPKLDGQRAPRPQRPGRSPATAAVAGSASTWGAVSAPASERSRPEVRAEDDRHPADAPFRAKADLTIEPEPQARASTGRCADSSDSSGPVSLLLRACPGR